MTSPAQAGTLYLIPVGLSTPGDTPEDWALWAPAETRAVACRLHHFVVENAKTARGHLKSFGHSAPLRDLDIQELPRGKPRLSDEEAKQLLAPLRNGQDLGLMSEAGCPAVADPGAQLVRAAHRHGIKVKPLIGPSALLLALMASGLDGQQFAFHGYLPVRDPERSQQIQRLENESRRANQTQLFIETPYRNMGMLEALLKVCKNTTLLCIASDLGLPSEIVISKTVSEWKKTPLPSLEKRPTVFLLLSEA